MRRAPFLLTVLLFAAGCFAAQAADAPPIRVALVGWGARTLEPVLTQAGMTATTLDAIPGDAAQLAASADVVVVMPASNHPLTPEEELTLENFVRSGGGLWLDASGGAPKGWLGSMTTGMALDGRRETWVTLDPVEGSPLADLNFKTLPRFDHGLSLAPPGSGQLDLLNVSCPWYFSKPLQLDSWQTWVTGPAPHRLSFMTVARYGAGRTAAWSAGKGLNDPALAAWPDYPELCRRTIKWLAAGAPASGFAALHPVKVEGLTGSKTYCQDLGGGLKGMAQKQTLADFQTPPVTLLESGFTPTADDSAPAAALFGDKASASSSATVVLRAPYQAQSTSANTFEPKTSRSSDVATATFVDDQGKDEQVSLPHTVSAPSTPYPTIGSAGAAPEVDLPTQWKIDYALDADRKEDFAYAKPDFDDSQWKDAALGKQTSTLFGYTFGYDGAIWYRGHIKVPADSTGPDCILSFVGDAQHLEVYIDGKRVAVEPKKASVALSTIGAGDHLVAVRTFGELRTNYGLISVTPTRLPLLWRPDPHQDGWAGNWASADADLTKWQPVASSFGDEPAGREAMEGWVRLPVDVPENAPPFAVRFHLALNVSSRLFINGQPQEAHSVERFGLYTIPGSSFHAGHNVVVFWTRFYDNQAKSITGEVVSTQPHVYRATVHADHAGQSLQAEISYEHPLEPPCVASIRVNGHIAGGWIGSSGSDALLVAPQALAAGDNAVEIAVTGAIDGSFGLKNITTFDFPDNTRVPVPGWTRLRADQAPADWYQPQTNDDKWPSTGYVYTQDWEKIWVSKLVPDLGDPDYVYRTHLNITEQDLKKNLSLFLKAPSIHTLFVNGQPVSADEESFYSLNRALKAGDNVLAFQPSRASYSGTNILLPGGRDSRVYQPELRTDVAPLVPAVPELAGFRLNRTFPVTSWQPPAGSRPLFCRPNGDPAIVIHTNGGQSEILAAPGIFDQAFPGPNPDLIAQQTGATSTVSYEYGAHLVRDGLLREAYEQLIPALLAYGEGRKEWITGIQPGADHAQIILRGPPGEKAQFVWRLLDWEGNYLTTGTADVMFGQDGTAQATVQLPDLTDGSHDAGTGMGRFVRLRAALLSADRRETLAHLERLVYPAPAIDAYVRLDAKIPSIDAANGAQERRILHMEIDQITERVVYLPGETARATAFLENATSMPQTATVNLTATGGLDGKTLKANQDVKLAPYEKKTIILAVPPGATATEQPWQVLLEVSQDGQVISRDRRSFVVAQPRGEITDVLEANRQGRSAGGYMWQMTPHALAIEHRYGTDALAIPGPWWTAVRQGGDGNWLVAEGAEEDSQTGLLWGPFFDQGRGEVINSFGWFPNGQSFRQWWAPYAMRELPRTNGDQSVVFNLSDWWQYDAGYPANHYETLEAFNEWLAAHKGQTVAGIAIDGQPIGAATISGMLKQINDKYLPAFTYFLSEGLAHDAAFTGAQIEATSPGSTQMGQGAYAERLPGTVGGVNLASQWAHFESLAILDADNHCFAGIYQYALESDTFRALGVNNRLLTHWEIPTDYHAVRDTPASLVPMDASFWENRQLDSHWQVITDDDGAFQRVFNVTHDEVLAGPQSGILERGAASIGSGTLPAHWDINDKISALSMTIGVAKPRAPLFLVGESDADWVLYYSMLGKFRDAGLDLGGAINVAELEKLKPEDVPGLVWMPSADVAGPLLAAVRQKVEAGVPLLMIGKVPTSENDDWAKWLGLQANDGPPDDLLTQTVDPSTESSPNARGLEQKLAGHLASSLYTALPGGMKPIVQRGGRVVLGVSDAPGKKVVFDGLLFPIYDADDAELRRLAVEFFKKMAHQTVEFDDQTGGYAFKSLDGALYIVVENRKSYATQARVQVNVSVGAAASLLTGEKFGVSPNGKGAEVTVPLQADGATVVVIKPSS
jgi:hypothetical protein